ncbi:MULTISPECIES: hypothetical protein [unclassified Halomonas]|uniref:hypothetical protein n=1 Tax=unclassified Halomonas TaxID=2609666 RepID=UPI0021E4F994|nr:MULTISPECIES: hypothetical protein [unclassified Halomonas]UYG00017.1 hypothetical protein OCT39_00240 [Halomonas sp. GD1P12]WNL38895.1 hypothetical protein RN346_16645 [Halomonas sp. PAMB 3232]WNL42234.1 hypothetical protein RN347_16675 [Halomonas sp. PAMB 3264]
MKHSATPFSAPFVPMMGIYSATMMALELWSTSLSTIAQRQHLWQTQPFFSPGMMLENQRMVTEKMEASIEAGMAMQKAFFGAMNGHYAPWWVTSQKTMSPYHRRSRANSRRLSR